MQKQTALLCSMLMFWVLVSGPVAPVHAAPRLNIRERVLSLPAGSVVEVKLEDTRKLKGRLGSIDDNGFELQFLQGNQVTTERVPFDGVRSVKGVEQGMRTSSKVILGALAGVGVFFLVLIAVCLGGACGS